MRGDREIVEPRERNALGNREVPALAFEERTVRTRAHKLTLERISGAGELYDLSEDPDEMINRFDDPAYAKVRRELTDMIASRPADERPTRLPQVGMA